MNITSARSHDGDEMHALRERIADLEQQVSVLRQANPPPEQPPTLPSPSASAYNGVLEVISHELRTPLNVITGFCETLLEGTYGSLNEQQQNALALVDKNGRLLTERVSAILEYAQLETGRMPLTIDLVSIAEVCRVSLHRVQQAAAEKQISLSSSLTIQNDMLATDEKHVLRVLHLLLANAIKFTPPEGQVGLTVSCHPPHRLVFTVWDTGIGIAPEQQAHLFAPFTQQDSSLSRRFEGMGLGLALVSRFAHLLGGEIAVESTLGEGSRFMLSLPVSSSTSRQTQNNWHDGTAPSLPQLQFA